MVTYILYTDDFEIKTKDFKHELVGSYNAIDEFINDHTPTILDIFTDKGEALTALHKYSNQVGDVMKSCHGIAYRTITEFFIWSYEHDDGEPWEDGEFRDIYTL